MKIRLNKAVTAAVFTVIASAIALSVGIWAISLVFGSVQLPTVLTSVANETITFTTNDTYYSFANQPSCLSDVPLPGNCGVGTTGVTNVGNLTMNLNTSCYTWTTSQIKILNLGTLTCGLKTGVDYVVTYDYYTYSNQNAATNFRTVQTNTFNALLLLSVGLIVMGAASIISYFYMGKQGGY